jgi:hypothetical protein
MNERRPRPDDELLSAYFDGEVTADERARVELLLGTSPAAKAEFEALGDVSQLVKSLPRLEAPPELRAAVRRAAERTKPVVATAPVRRRLVREAVIFATGMLVAGVAVMVFPGLPQREQLGRDVVSFSTPAPTPVSSDETTPVSLEDESGMRLVDEGGRTRLVMRSISGTELAKDSASESLSGRARPTAIPEVNGRGPTLAAGATMAAGAAPRSEAVSPDAVVDGTSLESKTDVVKNFTDALPYVSVANDYMPNQMVMNVDLYVTDAQRGVDRFRHLLNQNGVATEEVEDFVKLTEADPKAAAATTAPAAEKKVLLGAEQLAVFVDAPPEPVVRSLEQLSQQPELLGVRLRPPLELPLEEAARTVREADANRQRALDVQVLDERIRAAYNEYLTIGSLDGLAEGEVPEESAAPADALSALVRDLTPSQVAQRTKSVQRRLANQRYSIDAPAPVTQAPIPPIPGVQMEASQLGTNRLLRIPQTTYSTSRGGGQAGGEPLDRAATLQTAPSVALQEEQRQQRMRLDNNAYYNSAHFNNVRVLFVLQENAEAGKTVSGGAAVAAPVVPAAPAATSPAPEAKK